VTLNLAETSVVKSRPSVPYGANLFVLVCIVFAYTKNVMFLSLFVFLFVCLCVWLSTVLLKIMDDFLK